MNKKILIANQIRTFGLHISSMPVLKFFKPYKLFDKIAEGLGYFQYQSALLSLAKTLSDKGVNYQELIQDVEIVPTKEKNYARNNFWIYMGSNRPQVYSS